MCIFCFARAVVAQSRVRPSVLTERAATPTPAPTPNVASFTNFMTAVNGGTLEGTEKLAIIGFMVAGPETDEIIKDLIDVLEDAGCDRDSIAPIGEFQISKSVKAEIVYVIITEATNVDDNLVRNIGAVIRGNMTKWLDEGNYIGAVNIDAFTFADVVGTARRGCIALPQSFCYERSEERSLAIGEAHVGAMDFTDGKTMPLVPTIAIP